MKFLIPVTVAQFCKIMKGMQTISVYNFKFNRYDFRGDPGDVPEDLKMLMVTQYYYRTDIGLAIVHV